MKTKMLNDIRTMLGMTNPDIEDVAVLEKISEMSDYVFTKKLELIEKNALDLTLEKVRADKYFSMLSEREPVKGSLKMKFMYKLYMKLEDYEKVSILSKYV